MLQRFILPVAELAALQDQHETERERAHFLRTVECVAHELGRVSCPVLDDGLILADLALEIVSAASPSALEGLGKKHKLSLSNAVEAMSPRTYGQRESSAVFAAHAATRLIAKLEHVESNSDEFGKIYETVAEAIGGLLDDCVEVRCPCLPHVEDAKSFMLSPVQRAERGLYVPN